MKINQLIKKLDEFYPLELQLSWDNSGLQIGDKNSNIKKVYICLDLEDFHVENAIKENANLIITHHPLFMKDVKQLEKGSFYYDVIKKLILNDINVLSYHTPFDISIFGMKNFFISKLKTNEKEVFAIDENKSLGSIFDIETKKLSEIVDLIKAHYIEFYDIKDWSNFIRVYGNMDRKIKRIAYLGGSGADFISDAVDKRADLYITGDIKYHDAQLAYRNNLNLIDLSHGISEIHFVDVMNEKLKELGIETVKNYWTYDRKLVD